MPSPIGESELRADGHVVLPACFSAEECGAMLESVSGLDRAGTRCLLDRPWCRDLAVELKRRALRHLPELAELSVVQCTYFSKAADSNWFVAWHQDRSIPVAPDTAGTWPGWSSKEGMVFVQGPDEVMARMLALRLHLDDCGNDNGPLRVLSGSHREGTLSPERIEVLRQQEQARELTVAQGGVVAMRPMLLHASPKSRSGAPRRVLHFLFGPRDLPDGLAWNR